MSKGCIHRVTLHINLLERTFHCVKRLRIRSHSGSHFPTFEWIRRYTEYLSVFNLNAGKYGQEKLWIRTLFTQCHDLLKDLPSQREHTQAYRKKCVNIAKSEQWRPENLLTKTYLSMAFSGPCFPVLALYTEIHGFPSCRIHLNDLRSKSHVWFLNTRKYGP